MSALIAPRNTVDLYAAWRALAGQRLRQRDIAARLQVSEAELLASAIGMPSHGLQVLRLASDPAAIDATIAALPTLGRVMALTRNGSCVHEKLGRYERTELGRHASLVLGPDIDLRLFQRRWRTAFAVTELTARGVQRSLQFYLADGTATHKVFLRPESDVAAWLTLIESSRAADQTPGLEVEPQPAAARTAGAPDLERFRIDWLAMRDTHEFFGLLRRHGLARLAALRAAPPGHARLLGNDAARMALERAAARGLPIMVFVGNRGCIQIHTGPVRTIGVIDGWLNVFDPGFSLHLRTGAIAQSWVVRKPTDQGPVTSIELYDAAGDTIAMLFGERKPDRPELAAWQSLVGEIEREASA